jgi:wyosine [tRNA(Phe)-imidazoG37] synthetase (radical SAM superfamily)
MTTYVFGPVPSRRLGRSLGVDLVPFKTCTYDCTYCQLGRTSRKTTERRQWVPLDDVLGQLRLKLKSDPDYVTLSGSGEPTLYADLDRLIDGIKEITQVPIAVLTNGSLLWQEDVRRQLRRADLVMPTLAAGDERTYRTIHRPDEGIHFERMLDGLIRFRQEFHGRYWLEVFLLGGCNDSEEHIQAVSRCVDRIGPGRVQLNTVARPPAESSAKPVPRQRLAEIALRFSPPAQIIAEFDRTHHQPSAGSDRDAILALLQRRPCTIDDIASGLGLHRNAILKHLELLRSSKEVMVSTMLSGSYYHAVASRENA